MLRCYAHDPSPQSTVQSDDAYRAGVDPAIRYLTRTGRNSLIVVDRPAGV